MEIVNTARYGTRSETSRNIAIERDVKEEKHEEGASREKERSRGKIEWTANSNEFSRLRRSAN